MEALSYLNYVDSLPLLDQDETYNDQIAEYGRKSLYFLAKHILGYKDLTLETHECIIENLESKDKRKLLCLPRGCFKSSLASVSYPIWRLLNNPQLRILIDSEVFTNSSTFLREIKGHLQSQHMIELYGRFRMDHGAWNDTEINIAQRKYPFRKEANITCSGIGAEKTGQHYDLIIIDDLNSPKNSQTPELRQKAIDHFRSLNSILEPDGEMVIIGTRYAQDDLIGHVLRLIYSESEASEIETKGT